MTEAAGQSINERVAAPRIGNRRFRAIAAGLRAVGLTEAEADAVMGGNWQRFFAAGFGPAST